MTNSTLSSNTASNVGGGVASNHRRTLTNTHKQDVYVATSSTGLAPYTPLRVTAASNDTEADLHFADTFIGDYLEGACRNGTVIIHYTANYVAKQSSIFPGGSAALLVRQQDTFLGKVTLP